MPPDGKKPGELLDEFKDELEEKMEDEELNIDIDLDKNGKPDVKITLKGKLAVIAGIVIIIAAGVTKGLGMW